MIFIEKRDVKTMGGCSECRTGRYFTRNELRYDYKHVWFVSIGDQQRMTSRLCDGCLLALRDKIAHAVLGRG